MGLEGFRVLRLWGWRVVGLEGGFGVEDFRFGIEDLGLRIWSLLNIIRPNFNGRSMV